MTPAQRSIIAAAEQSGMDPTFALAIAERESRFNPTARASKSMAGAYQMSGQLRQQYGIGDSTDIGQQTQGWSKFFRQNQYDMSKVLGRAPTDEEGYLGHYFGGTRAARMMKMDPATPVDQVFTPNEIAQNPEFAKAGTVGALNSSVLADVKSRHSKYQDVVPNFSGEAEGTAEKPDFSSQGEEAPDYAGNLAKNQKWAKPGNYRTDLGNQEPAFQKWVKDNKVPFDVNKTGPDDYDMRGFWKSAQEGDPHASTAPNPNDGLIHYDDKWKTPYHKSFSNESQWAQPNAPAWNEKDQLIDPSNGSVVYDEKAPQSDATPDKPDFSSMGTPVGQQPATASPPTAPDFSDQGTPVDNPMMIKGPVQTLGIRG